MPVINGDGIEDRIQEYIEAITDVKVKAAMQEIVFSNANLNARLDELEGRIIILES